MRRMILPAMLLIAVACQPQDGPLSDDDMTAIGALAPAMDEIALASDFDALVALFAEDCVVMGPNAAATEGRSNFRAMIESGGFQFSEYVTEFLDVYGYGDVAYVRGTYSETYTMQGVAEPLSDTGKLLTVVRKQPDGSWRFSVWMWSSDLPLTATEGEHEEGGDRS
jgi:uncharacterized protein (TIGR02246 family)